MMDNLQIPKIHSFNGLKTSISRQPLYKGHNTNIHLHGLKVSLLHLAEHSICLYPPFQSPVELISSASRSNAVCCQTSYLTLLALLMIMLSSAV